MPSFNDFSLLPVTRAALASMGISEPTPIQAEAIPTLLGGHDLVGQSATGSGKTLAYGIPLVERVAQKERAVQALVLVPTRELAVQVSAVLGKVASNRRLTMALLVGGRPYGNQLSSLRYGSQIVVGTPGRVKDHLERGSLVLSQLRVCVLDEADQMLDSGFAPVIEEILTTTPETRQMALFSATMPEWVAKLEQKFLKNPVRIAITPATGEQSTIEQIAYQVPSDQKMAALCTLLHSAQGESTLIFGKTKFGVERLGKQLNKLGFTVGTLHGNKSQRAREDVLGAFRRGQVQTLLATNVAARGLDVKGIYQVINYELPESSELFTHRIGRTGRMGQQGKAITLLSPADLPKWRRMARSLGQVVALQKLAINEEAMATMLLAKPEAEITLESEQASTQRPARERKLVSFVREQNNELQPARERKQSSSKREQNDDPRPARAHKQFEREQMSEPRPVRARKQFEREQMSEPRPARRREQFEQVSEPRPGRGRKPWEAEYEQNNEPRSERQPRMAGRAPAWQSDGPRSSATRAKHGGRATGKPSRFGGTPGKPKTQAFVDTEGSHQPAPRKFRAASTTPTRRAAASKRSARR